MIYSLKSVKPIMLMIAMTIGFFVNCTSAKAAETRTLTVAGGCFWCVESDFERVPGVIEAVSGFTGGKASNPTYKQVTGGGTGHYEAVQITYDPSKVSADKLLYMFFRSIDPTDAGGQFCDRGDSYRTAVFFDGADQKQSAERAKSEAGKALGRKIVTPILPAQSFYPASDYHQDYYKSSKIILTRFGPRSKAEAYKRYRAACGRDDRVKDLWGKDAPFVGNHS